MRRINSFVAPKSPQAAEPTEGAPAAPFDVEDLLAKGGELLRREMLNLMGESTRGKLAPASARDLVAYVKLLSELKTAQKAELEQLTEEELEALASHKTSE